MGQAAARIGRQHALQRRLIKVPGEGVMVGHCTVAFLVRGLIAFDFELNPAQARARAARLCEGHQPVSRQQRGANAPQQPGPIRR